MGQSVFPVPSTLTTKGDLLAYDTAPNRLPVGADGTTLVANSASATGMAWSGPSVAAGKNFVINGDCSIAQRGISFTSPSAAYTLDRWCATSSAGGTTWVVSQVASFLTGNRYAIRTQRTSGQTGTPNFFLGMAFETSDVIKLQGQTVTWSFYAKAGADFSTSGLTIAVQFNTGTGTDQGPFVAHTGEINQINTTATLSKTVATRYTYSFTVPSNATSARWNFNMLPTGTAGTNDYFDITNMQLEIGSVPTAFSRAGGTLQGELAACQRYFQVENVGVTFTPRSGNTAFADGVAFLPVTMRAMPSLSVTAPLKIDQAGVANFTQSSGAVTIGGFSDAQNVSMNIGNFTGLPTNNAWLILRNDGGKIYLSSEL